MGSHQLVAGILSCPEPLPGRAVDVKTPHPVVPNYAQTGLSGVQLKAGLQPFSWRPSCCPGWYAVVATAQEPPEWGGLHLQQES